MDVWRELARAETDEGDTIILRRRGDIYDIRFNGWELMSSSNSVSETTLARVVCGQCREESPKILIGGLGMGYTLRAVLDTVGGAMAFGQTWSFGDFILRPATF